MSALKATIVLALSGYLRPTQLARAQAGQARLDRPCGMRRSSGCVFLPLVSTASRCLALPSQFFPAAATGAGGRALRGRGRLHGPESVLRRNALNPADDARPDCTGGDEARVTRSPWAPDRGAPRRCARARAGRSDSSSLAAAMYVAVAVSAGDQAGVLGSRPCARLITPMRAG